MKQLMDENQLMRNDLKDLERIQETNEDLVDTVDELKRQLAEAKQFMVRGENTQDLHRVEIAQLEKENHSLTS